MSAQYGRFRLQGFIWEFPKIRGPSFRVLMIRILLFRVLYWDPLCSEATISPSAMSGISTAS